MYFCTGCDKDHSDDYICRKDIYRRSSYNRMPWRLEIAAKFLSEIISYAGGDTVKIARCLELADKLIAEHEVTKK